MTAKRLKLTLAYFILLILFLSYSSCKKKNPQSSDPGKPQRVLKEYFDKKYLLYRLPVHYYANEKLNGSFISTKTDLLSGFMPLGYNTELHLQYTHVYSPECIYHISDSIWKYAEVCFPNTCLTKDKAYASVKVRNTSSGTKTFYLRLFYQNTSYWYRTDDSIDLSKEAYLDNYYGASEIVEIKIAGNHDSIAKIPYTIGMNPKHELHFDPSKDPARAGNYEFLLLALPAKDDLLMNEKLDLKKANPFAVVKKDELQNGGKKYFNYSSYTDPHHFKFVFLDEYFDGVNDTTPNHIYIVKDGKQKNLCDTCTGWYRRVINEQWRSGDFFKGFISKCCFIKPDYGVKKENCRIDTNGVTLTIPKSTEGNYKKTWGEFLFGPSIKYGHLTVRAKFAQMINKTRTPNGIIHNLWLYQRDPDPVDTTNPYSRLLRDPSGSQRYEIDFEIWSSTADPLDWDPRPYVNYSIVDYMRDPNVKLKPGEKKTFNHYKADRANERQLNIPGVRLDRSFFNSFHTYEMYWYPDHVRFLVDGTERAVITKDMASIPDKYLYLWISSPLYQDGTYFSQSSIPFLKEDKQTIVDYIRIE